MVCDVVVPIFAEGATTIKLSKWLYQVGEKIEACETLAEATTDKIAIEIEVPVSGYISELLVTEGEKVHVGQVIARVTSEAPGRANV